MAKHGIHIVGSVPLANAAEVFETLAKKLGPGLQSLPDGETGPRLNWLPWLEPIFSGHPDFEPTQEVFMVHAGATRFKRYALKPGVDPKSVRFTKLPHARFALESWQDFKRLKTAGVIPANVRYQCDIASIPSLMAAFVVEALHEALSPALEQAVVGEAGRICAAVPHGQLAIQYDVASSIFFHLESGKPTKYGATREEMMKSFVPMHVRLGNAVPKDVHLCYHLCYGDNRHKHSIEPQSMVHLVNFANRLSAGIGRTIEMIHMPVPRERHDEAYFEPLKDLKMRPETKLALGLVHYTDGIEGTRRRMATADKYAGNYMIGTECGFGRRDPATLPKLLDIHAEAAGLR
ncbi:MAG: hypothetical protein A3I01_19920 [Betaproteobacteria bacterium RIFCSPLOWO2_02_FULL_65_24]|nr:MAG: hypothetical protein A3I01_19920 [Betaproteobacteria bacterium RIFCSPLOWO2_02_FULL_65_24]OGA31604.1 MAG: hypothetical protein A3G80_10190 [Betaproteobacteria bacterium RIFCSPLOWO2_12_FULL_62_13b]